MSQLKWGVLGDSRANTSGYLKNFNLGLFQSFKTKLHQTLDVTGKSKCPDSLEIDFEKLCLRVEANEGFMVHIL